MADWMVGKMAILSVVRMVQYLVGWWVFEMVVTMVALTDLLMVELKDLLMAELLEILSVEWMDKQKAV